MSGRGEEEYTVWTEKDASLAKTDARAFHPCIYRSSREVGGPVEHTFTSVQYFSTIYIFFLDIFLRKKIHKKKCMATGGKIAIYKMYHKNA